VEGGVTGEGSGLGESLTVEAIRRAAAVIAPHVHRTPLLRCATLGRMTGVEVHLKPENWQKTGSFKPRGALNRIATLTPEEARRGVLAASAGNHAQGLAYAAAARGIRMMVVMPARATAAKLEATRSLGAEIVLHGEIYDDALARSLEIARETGMTYVHPNADPDVLAGAGTIGLEIAEDLPEVDAVVVPVGGGGLISGIGTALRAAAPRARIFGVNPEGAPAMARSFREGRPVTLERAASIADGMAGRSGTAETLPLVKRLVEDVVTVSESAILEAILLLLSRAKLLAEGAGAGPLAALLEKKVPLAPGAKVVLVISGGNLDLDRLAGWIRDGIA
jgi:threonine dehydratase